MCGSLDSRMRSGGSLMFSSLSSPATNVISERLICPPGKCETLFHREREGREEHFRGCKITRGEKWLEGEAVRSHTVFWGRVVVIWKPPTVLPRKASAQKVLMIRETSDLSCPPPQHSYFSNKMILWINQFGKSWAKANHTNTLMLFTVGFSKPLLAWIMPWKSSNSVFCITIWGTVIHRKVWTIFGYSIILVCAYGSLCFKNIYLFHFRIVSGLQKCCKESTESLHVLNIQFPCNWYLTGVWYIFHNYRTSVNTLC